MRYLFTLFLAVLIGSSLFAQEVEEKQRTLITKRTASWCTFCGTWGWDFKQALLSDNEDKAVFIAAHYSGDLLTQEAVDLTDNFGGIGQPNFFVGNDRLPAGSSSWPTFQTSTKEFVEANFERAPLANTGISADIDLDGNLFVETKTEFFQEGDGDYYLSIYLLENNLINNQSGFGANANHSGVLIQSASGAFGESIASGTVAAGSTFDKSYTFSGLDFDNTWDYEVVAIIWDLDFGIRQFVNTFSLSGNMFAVPVSTQNTLASDLYQVSPSLSKDEINIRLNDVANAQVNINLFDINGQLIKTLFDGQTRSDLDVQVSKSTLGISNGTYFIHLNVDGQRAIEKVMFIE